jgi:two-component sensor histidine kinase
MTGRSAVTGECIVTARQVATVTWTAAGTANEGIATGTGWSGIGTAEATTMTIAAPSHEILRRVRKRGGILPLQKLTEAGPTEATSSRGGWADRKTVQRILALAEELKQRARSMPKHGVRGDFANTIRGATAPYHSESGGRFSIAGPDIKIRSGAVIALAMNPNELCTNTTKLGALSVPAGSVDITWKIDHGMERLLLIWSEKDGPSVCAPSRQSFATRLIGSLGQQLKGQVELAYDSSGFAYTLDVPMSSLVASA